MYIARKLEINRIIPRDFELVELGRNIGLRERRIFSKESKPWKIGLHSEKSKTGIYTHSLYRGTERNREGNQIRHPVINEFPYTIGTILYKMSSLTEDIIKSNRGKKKLMPRTIEKYETLKSLNKILVEYTLTPKPRKENGRLMYENASKVINDILK